MSTNNTIFDGSAANFAFAFRANDITSDWMKQAIKDWFDLYFQREASKKADPCQKIPFTIVQKITKAAFSEYSATSKDEFAQKALDALREKTAEAMQMALIGGECKLKPVLSKDGFRFLVVNRGNILVFGRDEAGNMTDIGTTEKTADANFYYTLLERRTVDANGYLTIRNALYRSGSKEALGQQVPLQTLPKYEMLPDVYTFPNPVGSVGMSTLKTPMVNCVDGGPDCVSVYAAAAELIHNINRNEAQLNGEFERGESRIIVSRDLMKTDAHGRPTLEDNVFVGLDDDQETVGVTIFSPELREASFLARKQEYLRNVENVIGLKRGLLSEVEAAERTATEITSSQGEYNLTIIDFQRMWEQAVREAVRLCGVLGQMYNVSGAHEVAEDAIVFNWGNGVLYDEEATRTRMLSEVQAGLLQPERYLGHVYKQPCETDAQRAKIRKDYMPEVAEEPEEDE